MLQLSLFGETESESVVNVASVPQRSPFRYAGGKTWLVPHMRQWLHNLEWRPSHFIEPFAGGASIGLMVAAENWADHVTLIELDKAVGAVWETIFNDEGGGEWLAESIVEFDLNEANVRASLVKQPLNVREGAFQTILKNRVNRGGILANGAGLIKTGENGKGLASRWYPQTLRRRILELTRLRSKISFISGDGLAHLERSNPTESAVYFIDPPYSVGGKRAGSRLYNHNQLDHARLFQLVDALDKPFLMTYDDVPEVHLLAQHHQFTTRPIAMKNTHHTRLHELLIEKP